LEAPNPNADPLMARYAQGLVDADYARKPEDVTGQVQRLVVALLSTGPCTIEVAAQHLGITKRTIHRRLADEGTTFSDIVDGVRRELAVRYVADTHRTLADVSALLGFSAPSNFSRWYRRQFGRPAAAQRSTRTASRKV